MDPMIWENLGNLIEELRTNQTLRTRLISGSRQEKIADLAARGLTMGDIAQIYDGLDLLADSQTEVPFWAWQTNEPPEELQ